MNRTITIGLAERHVPLIDGRVVTWLTFSERQVRNGYRDLGLTPAQIDRYHELVGRPCINGYPGMMEAFDVAQKAEGFALEVMLDLGELLEVEVRSCWFPTKDGVCMSTIPPRSLGGPGNDTRPQGNYAPFHFDDQTLTGTGEDEAVQKAAVWYKLFERECDRMNRTYYAKSEMKMEAVAADERIIEAAKKIK